MTDNYTKLKLDQTEELLRPYRKLSGAGTPRGGWVRAIRDALGMSAAQLAARLGVIRQTVEDYERNEAAGKITLESLNKLARALNCRLVYALVPEKPPAETRRERAFSLADSLIKPVAHSMKLEGEGVSEKETRRQRKELAEEFLRGSPRKLWR